MSEKPITRWPIRTALMLALHTVCGVTLLWLLFKLVPQYEKIFRDFGVALPHATQLVIDLSNVFGKFRFILAPVIVAGDAAAMLLLNRFGRVRLMMALGIVLCLCALLLISLILTAIFVPLNDLVTNLSAGKS